MSGQVSPLAGKTIEPSMLVNVPRLVTAYFTGDPDPTESWPDKFGQQDKWSFCLRAAKMAEEQERR